MMSRVAPHPEELMGIAFLRIPSNAAGMIAECGEGIISRYLAEGKLLTNLLNLAASMMLENGSSTSPIISWP